MVDDSTTIVTPKGYKIPYYGKVDKDHFLNRSIVLYGQSDTGKSSMIKHILYYIQAFITWGLVVAPSDNGDFDTCIDRIFIKRDVTIERLYKIFKRQEMARDIYKKANDVKVLEKLFNRVAPRNQQQLAQKIKTTTEYTLKKISNDNSLNSSQKSKEKKKIEKRRDADLTVVYKAEIIKHRDSISKKGEKLDENEKYSLKYLTFCPNILLIFDDCAAKINGWLKNKKHTTLKEMFYNGRHYFITHIYSVQDEKELDTLIRKNVFVSFFGNSISAITFFDKASVGITKEKKKEVMEMIDVLYTERPGVENYKKLMYARKLVPSFQYCVADIYEDDAIYIGGYPVRVLCEKVRLEGRQLDTTNPFHNSFKV
jgi:hypothetical protein